MCWLAMPLTAQGWSTQLAGWESWNRGTDASSENWAEQRRRLHVVRRLSNLLCMDALKRAVREVETYWSYETPSLPAIFFSLAFQRIRTQSSHPITQSRYTITTIYIDHIGTIIFVSGCGRRRKLDGASVSKDLNIGSVLISAHSPMTTSRGIKTS